MLRAVTIADGGQDENYFEFNTIIVRIHDRLLRSDVWSGGENAESDFLEALDPRHR